MSGVITGDATPPLCCFSCNLSPYVFGNIRQYLRNHPLPCLKAQPGSSDVLLVNDVADAPLVLSPNPIVGPIIRDVYQLIGERLGLEYAGTIIKGGEPTMIGPRPSLNSAKRRHAGVATYRLEGFAGGKAGAYLLGQLGGVN